MRLQTVARSSASTCRAGTSDARSIDRAILLGTRLDSNTYKPAQQVDEANRHAIIACVAVRPRTVNLTHLFNQWEP